MTYTFWQFAFVMQAFTFAHLLCTFFYLIQIVLHFFHPANRIRSHRITKLFQTELHIVKIRNSLSQFIRNICKHCLEITKSYTGIIRIFCIHHLISLCIRNECHDTPIVFTIVPIRFSGIGRNKREHFTIYIIRTLFHKFFADMPGYSFNVRLQHLHILENSMVHTLQYIVGGICFKSSHFIRVVNQPAA